MTYIIPANNIVVKTNIIIAVVLCSFVLDLLFTKEIIENINDKIIKTIGNKKNNSLYLNGINTKITVIIILATNIHKLVFP